MTQDVGGASSAYGSVGGCVPEKEDTAWSSSSARNAVTSSSSSAGTCLRVAHPLETSYGLNLHCVSAQEGGGAGEDDVTGRPSADSMGMSQSALRVRRVGPHPQMMSRFLWAQCRHWGPPCPRWQQPQTRASLDGSDTATSARAVLE